MSSIKRKPGTRNWMACYTDHTGKRIQRSTGIPGKKEAQKLADEWEGQASTAPPPPPMTVRKWLADWLAANKGAVSDATFLSYDHRADNFLKHLKAKADGPLGDIMKPDVIGYRTALLARVSPMSANLAVKIIRMIFEAARREKHITENPAEGVKALKDEGKVERRPFTRPELDKLLAVAAGEWRSMILFGVYTGQRLNDIALLTWSNIDMTAGEIRFKARKTGRFMVIPLAEPLARHIATLEAGGDRSAHVLPELGAAALRGKLKVSNTLSGQFRNLMAAAGLGQIQPHRALKKGRGVRREMRELCFHSLRHTATSLMKNAGVSEAVVMDIIGHDSPAVSSIYTHIESGAKRKALDSMPDLL